MYVIIENDWVKRCALFAKEVCASYAAGSKEHSRKLMLSGKPEIFNNPHVQMVGRIGEVASCLALRMNPVVELNWSDLCDDGKDFMLRRWSVDVKSTDHPRARRLIWPTTKQHFMDKAADILIFAKVSMLDDGCADVDICGFIKKKDFLAICTHAKGERGIIDGTPYVDKSSLRPIEDIINWLLISNQEEGKNA